MIKTFREYVEHRMLSEASPPGWAGTIRAMLLHHPDKFGPGKLNPYAIAWAKKGKAEPHYEDQESSLKGRPKKKKKYRKKKKG